MTEHEFEHVIKEIEKGLEGDGYYVKLFTPSNVFTGALFYPGTRARGTAKMIGIQTPSLKDGESRQTFLYVDQVVAVEGPITPYGVTK